MMISNLRNFYFLGKNYGNLFLGQVFKFHSCRKITECCRGFRSYAILSLEKKNNLLVTPLPSHSCRSLPYPISEPRSLRNNISGSQLSRFFSSSSDNPVPKDANQQLSRGAKLKAAVKDYGSTIIVFHVAISLASMGGFYLAVSSGLDVELILAKIGVGAEYLSNQMAKSGSTFVIAYAVHKVFAPVRIGITLSVAPFIVRYLRKVGVLSKPL